MARPTIATKLFVPKLRRGLVSRPRLSERLQRGAESRLTLVSAPAGFGKTTLLAEWLGQTRGDDCRVAWVSLDPSDSEPSSYWTYVVTALRTVVTGIGSGLLELIASSPLPTGPVLTTLLNDLAATPGEVWLVLDDYHLVDSHEVRDGMTFLLEHLPPHVHIVISTRADPDLSLARWRARGELVEIRAADLRFTSDETSRYLDETTGLHLAAADVEVLEERTEGWVAALQLATLSIQGHDDVRGFIARFAGNDRYIVDYLVEEVLQHQPDPVRRFLLETSVLARLTGPLCAAVTGMDDGTQLLTALHRGNLFIVPLDDRREWYRYHHLFADVLRARLLAEQPDLVPLLHQRASGWYEDHDLVQESVGHALAARDFDRAAHLMEQAVPAIRRNRQEVMMIGWLKVLPDDAVRRSPVLSVFYGYMLMVSGDLDLVGPRLDDAERALAAVPGGSAPPWAENEELRTLPATIAIYRASLAQARGDIPGTAKHARRALALAGPSDHLARGGAAGFLGLAAWAQGDVSSALETFTQAVASLHAAGNLVDELSSTVVLAEMWLAAGHPSTARRLYLRALQVSGAQNEPVLRATPDLLVGLSERDYEVGDLEAAKGHLEQARALGESAAITESRHRWFVAMARVAAAEGAPQEAIALLDQAEQLYRPGFFPEVRPIAAMRARVWITQGNLSQASEWARVRGVSLTDDVSYLSEFDHLTLVRLHIARHREDRDTGDPQHGTGDPQHGTGDPQHGTGDPQHGTGSPQHGTGSPQEDAGSSYDADRLVQALSLLARLYDAAETSGRAGSLVEIRLLQALAHDAMGHRQQAREALGEVFAEAPEPGEYVRLLLDEGVPMMGLLRDAVRHGVAGNHARRLLSRVVSDETQARDGEEAAGARQRLAPPSADSLSERELQVLRLLDSELSGPQIARELFVSHNTLRTHTKHIFTKLEVTTRRAAVRRARERGLM